MKIAVTSQGRTMEDRVDPRFGRCAWFIIVETDDLTYGAVENGNAALGGGAGIQSAQLVAKYNVQCVLTGNCGPNAFRTLEAADIRVITGVGGTVKEAVEQFKSGAFSDSAASNVPGHFGQG